MEECEPYTIPSTSIQTDRIQPLLFPRQALDGLDSGTDAGLVDYIHLDLLDAAISWLSAPFLISGHYAMTVPFPKAS